MFTIEQIRRAHSKVKTGADFPAYIGELKALGVGSYEHFVTDGHITYHGANGFEINAGPKYPNINIAASASKDQLVASLAMHQQDGSDYPTFCRHAGEAGVDKWKVDIANMTCVYYTVNGLELLTEEIPDVK